MAAPASTFNLAQWADGIVNAGNTAAGYGSARLLVNGDSICSPTVGGRVTDMIRDTWRPYRWSGWFGISASTNYNISANPVIAEYGFTPVLAAAGAGHTFNHYDYAFTGIDAVDGSGPYVIGQQHHGRQSATYDTLAGEIATPNSYGEIFAPFSYRDLVFLGNVANNTVMGGWQYDYRIFDRFQSVVQPVTTANKLGNWTVDGDTVRSRLIYWRNPDGPTSLVWQATRGGTAGGTAVLNANGAKAVAFIDADHTAQSTSSNANRIYARVATDNLGTDETGTVLPLIAYRCFRPNTPGLEVSHWTQPGWRSSLFADTDLTATLSLSQYFEALGWPTHVLVYLGQNQTSNETTQLNVGTTTDFTANLAANLARINAAYALGSQAPPRYCLVSPFPLPATSLAAGGRTALNYETMDEALYAYAAANGHAFISLWQASMTPMETTDVAQGSTTYTQVLYSTDDIHPIRAGGMYLASAMWQKMVASVEMGGASGGLRGRGWRAR